MNKENKQRMRAMQGLRLPDLQARFHDIVGEPTRCPNKTYLLRRIAEALEAQEQEAAVTVEQTKPAEPTAPSVGDDKKLTELSVDQLRALHNQKIGRQTGSTNRPYLIWRIREARKGRIKVGQRPTRARSGDPTDVKILPLRLKADAADRMDQAWRSRGIKNRTVFLRQAIGQYLELLGEGEVAAVFTGRIGG